MMRGGVCSPPQRVWRRVGARAHFGGRGEGGL